MAQKSKFFRVAVDGATTDGRTIDRSWIEQMARNFDPQKYGARIWLEHIRGIYPDSDFRAYGDVTALKAEDVTIDGKKKLALFAQIEPLPDLVAMTTKNKQKVYTSIEVNPKFADTGEAYLVGLGVTDSPASLGTDVLSFAAQNPKANPFAARKLDPANLFSEAIEVTLEFEDDTHDDGKASTALQSVRDAIAKFTGRFKKQDSDVGELVEAVGELAEAFGTLADQHGANSKATARLSKDFATLQTAHTALQQKFETIDTTDAAQHAHRPAATGGNPKLQTTDC